MTDNKMPEQSISKCPRCGGYADNGFDRCSPPSPYVCGKCESSDLVPAVTDEAKKAALDDIYKIGHTYGGKLWEYSYWFERHEETIRTLLQTPSDTALRESHDRLLKAVLFLIEDMKKRIDSGASKDGRKDKDGYEFPWGNSAHIKLDEAITEAEKLQEGKL